MKTILERWFGRCGVADFPFEVRELDLADARVEALFEQSFRAPAPTIPRHFVAVVRRNPESVAGYVHYTVYKPGVFLLGGLCVDARVYRTLAVGERAMVAGEGSLARWLMKSSIQQLGTKQAVFGFTGDTRSRRDVFALGFEQTPAPYLVVQWHDQPLSARSALVAEVAGLGPF